jgi:hypothetical protein
MENNWQRELGGQLKLLFKSLTLRCDSTRICCSKIIQPDFANRYNSLTLCKSSVLIDIKHFVEIVVGMNAHSRPYVASPLSELASKSTRHHIGANSDHANARLSSASQNFGTVGIELRKLNMAVGVE